jgi:hypothetical protein
MNLTGQRSVIYPALLWDSDGATLVDRPCYQWAPVPGFS